MKTRAAVVPIAILFCRCFSPLLQSGTRMFRATGLPYPPLIPLRLLHSFSIAADLSISSHSLFLIILLLLLLLLRLLSSSRVVHFALLSSRSVDLSGPPNQLFFLPVTVQISIPETPRDRWGCGPFICARQCFSYVNLKTHLDMWILGIIVFEPLIEKLLSL